MHRQLQRVRGVMGLGVISGFIWAAGFAALVAVIALVDPASVDVGEGPLDVSPVGGIAGLVGGTGFGVLLSLAERGKSVVNISLLRAVTWGALGGALFPLLVGKPDQVFVFGPIGALVGLTLVGFAKKAASRTTPGLARDQNVVLWCVLALFRDAVGTNGAKVA